jgi:thiol-disulfide isomerase/thioredoxin
MSRRVLVLAVVFVCFALILWSGYQHRYAPPTTPAPLSHAAAEPLSAQETDFVTSPLLGGPAPNFALRDLAGHQVSLADYRGKAVLINFWATWCTPCQVEMPWFIALQQKYASQGFTVLGIDDSDYPEVVPKVPGFVRKMNLNYPVLYGNPKTYAAFGCCDYLPMSYYVDRAGTVRVATVGLGERDTVETYVRRLLQSFPPPSDTQVTAAAAATPPVRSK